MHYTHELKSLFVAASLMVDQLQTRVPVLKQYGMANWMLLRLLAADGAMSISAVAQRRGVSRQAAHKQISLLVERGLLVKLDDEQDRRKKLVKLTNEGLAQVASLERRLDAVAKDVSRATRDDDIAYSTELIERLSRQLFAQDIE